MTRSRENGVGPPDRDGKLVLSDFEIFVKNVHDGRTVSTQLF